MCVTTPTEKEIKNKNKKMLCLLFDLEPKRTARIRLLGVRPRKRAEPRGPNHLPSPDPSAEASQIWGYRLLQLPLSGSKESPSASSLVHSQPCGAGLWGGALLSPPPCDSSCLARLAQSERAPASGAGRAAARRLRGAKRCAQRQVRRAAYE